MKTGRIQDQLTAMFTRLSRRERLLALGAAVAFVLLTTTFTVTSVMGAMADRQSRIDYKEQGLEQVVALSAGFREAQAEQASLEAKLERGKNVSLFSFMEDVAKQQGVTIDNMTPRQPSTEGNITEQTVDVRLEGIPLAKLAGIINGIQRSPQMVKVKRLRVRRKFNDEEKVDATMTVATYSLAG